MLPSTIQRLLALNHQFYQTFAAQFSLTRQRLQPGVRRLLPSLPLDACLLDLGCGNGELARQLQAGGFHGHYLGLDFSPALLGEAANHLPPEHFTFQSLDLASQDWALRISPPFDRVLAFAILHHIPSQALRQNIAAQIHQLLAPDGLFLHSHWQFLDSPRLSKRIQPWSAAGMDETLLEPGDYLLDWRSGGNALRYVHLLSEAELAELAVSCDFRVLDSFRSDGEGGRLGLYQVWETQS